jgi:serine/threonine-protein kinase
VAIKLLHSEFARRPELSARFLREARAASRIEHENIVDVLDMGHDDELDAPFIVQEFLSGTDLRRTLDTRKKLPLREALTIIVPVMGALSAAHKLGIIHRDLKPANIFLSRTRAGATVPKLIDFGIAKLSDVGNADGSITRTGATLGTPLYMSPEQASGEKSIDAQTDIWAVGVVLYEMLAGKTPFVGDNYNSIVVQIATRDVPALTSVAPDVPPALASVIHQALERDRTKRYATIDAFLLALLAPALLGDPPWHRALREAQFGTDNSRITNTPESANPSPEALSALPLSAPGEQGIAPGGSTLAGATHDRATRPISRRTIAIQASGLLAVGLIATAVSIGISTRHRGATRPPPTAPSVVPVQSSPHPAAPASYHVTLNVTPATARIVLDGHPLGVGNVDRTMHRDGVSHRIEITADGYHGQSIDFVDAPPPAHIQLQAIPTEPTQLPSPAVVDTTPQHTHSTHTSTHGHHPNHRVDNGAPLLEE